EFYEEAKLLGEMERVFDICHGCRRCVNLCTAFPTLFDLVDASATLEVDGVEKSQFWEVVDQCYLCDMCYMTKCPYVPPHPWNVDFPHLMLRAKAVKFRKGEVKLRDRLLSATDAIGKLAAIPVVAQVVNAVNRNAAARSLMEEEACCGMPKLELGDLEGVKRRKAVNVPRLAGLAREGYAILTPVPSCTLMFKSELPLLFPDDAEVKAVSEAMFDPFEYFVLRKRDGLLKTDFKTALGKVSYHVPCHSRVQNMGQKTRETLQLVPGTTLNTVERCSGHDGTWRVKSEHYENSMKIGRPVFRQMASNEPDYISSDCPIAARHIEQGMGETRAIKAHPLSLLRKAYGI